MKKIIQYILFYVLSVSCGSGNTDRLNAASEVLEQRADSAYVLLKSVDYNKLKNDKDKADYALVRAYTNLLLGRSLVTDTLLTEAINYYRHAADTSSYLKAVTAQAYHLRSMEDYQASYAVIDSLFPYILSDTEQQKSLNQRLLYFANSDGDFNRSLSIIDRQIALASDENERIEFEVKKIVPLISLGRNTEAVALCDSILSLPSAPVEGSPEWIYLRINYAAALGEDPAMVKKAAALLEDVLSRTDSSASPLQLLGLYIPMINLKINAGDLNGARHYLNAIDKLGIDIHSTDNVAASYLEFLRIAMDYNTNGNLSLRSLANVVHSLREINNNLEIKRQERNDALENAYDLSRNNYELTIRQQRLWLIIVLIVFAALVITLMVSDMAHRRKRKLMEAEERIDTLQELVKSAQNPASDQKLGLLKRLLLQQLGIIKTFAESPTAQNQKALRKISNIGNSETPLDTLVKWEDLYPVIDELFDNFHGDLTRIYPAVFSEREIQIICLIRAGFSTKEIGVLTQQTSNSIYVSKTAIRKKLGLQQKEDFIAYLTIRFTSLKEA